MFIERRKQARTPLNLQMNLSCRIFNASATSSNVSRDGLCAIVPAHKVRGSLTQMLHENVTMTIDNVTFKGQIRYYFLMDSNYVIGIHVGRAHQKIWQKVQSNAVQQAFERLPDQQKLAS